ncbi:hypothetical protein ACVNPZ_09515 [Staphylococcus aureus]
MSRVSESYLHTIGSYHFNTNLVDLALASAITFVDIWHFFSLVNRYENEDKYDYLTGLGNVKEFDRHLNEISRKK